MQSNFAALKTQESSLGTSSSPETLRRINMSETADGTSCIVAQRSKSAHINHQMVWTVNEDRQESVYGINTVLLHTQWRVGVARTGSSSPRLSHFMNLRYSQSVTLDLTFWIFYLVEEKYNEQAWHIHGRRKLLIILAGQHPVA